MRLAKHIPKDAFKKEPHAKQYRYEIFYARGIRELSELLTKLASHPRQCVIRAHPISPLGPTEWIARTKRGPAASFLERKRHWMMIDVDGMPLSADHYIIADPETCARYVLEPIQEVVESGESVVIPYVAVIREGSRQCGMQSIAKPRAGKDCATIAT